MDTTAAATLEAEFCARLARIEDNDGVVAGLVGIEQEFRVRTPAAWPIDFRTLLPRLDGLAPPLDPDDPRARRTASGVVLTADGHEAEAVAPPIAVQPGFADDVSAWTRAARHELASRLDHDYVLHGYSTHLSVAVDDRRNVRLGTLFARTFAPGFMMLVDRATSPGLIIRPRPGRVELCGEFVDGPWMRAAAVYATGAVLACDEALTGKTPFVALPPQLSVPTRPARARAGWFVDRAVFGADGLAGDARRTWLRRCDGRRVRAQDHLEASWFTARAALQERASASDLAAVDDLVAARVPLPTEIAAAMIDAGDAGPLPAPSPQGDVARVRVRPGFTVEACAATWATTVFCLRARGRVREAYATIPRAQLASFFTALDGGGLDDVVGRYLGLAPTGRTAAMSPNEPSLGDVAPGAAAVTDAATAARLAEQVGGTWRRAAKAPHLHIPTTDGGSIVVVPTRPGCLVSPATRWIAGITAAVLLVVGVLAYLLTKGDDNPEPKTAPSPSSSSPSSPIGGLPACGTGATGLVLDLGALAKGCTYTRDQLGGGLVYRFERTPFATAAVDLGPGVGQPVIGGTCKNHNATAAERQAAADPTNGFIGLSLIDVSVGGLRPDGRVRIAARAPDQQVRTGDGIADKTGYAEVRIPINIPGPHTVISATYYPSGDPNSAGTVIPPSSITGGVLDGSFPTTQCDKAATLALVPKPTVNREQSDAGKEAVLDSASLWPLTLALAHPGADVELSGPYGARLVDGAYAVTGEGLTLNLNPVTRAGGDRPGRAPTSVYFHTGSVVGPGSTDSGDEWQHVFPCGPGNLALTVCAKGAPPLTDGVYGTVAAVFEQPVPLAGDQDVDYTFDVSGTKYRLRYDSAAGDVDGWTLTGGDPRARVMIRNNVVMLLTPLDGPADATYQISTSVDGKRDQQPKTPAPLRGTITVAPVPGVETPQQFLDGLSAAITNRDSTFLSSRLHPAVITRYGKAACDAYTSSGLTPVQFVVTEVKPPSSYAWTTDGQTTNVPDTNEVSVRQTAGGTTGDRSIHIARVDGTWRWFTDCTA